MSRGFQNAGFEIVCAFDKWAPAVAVYSDNFNHPVHELDLSSARALETALTYNADVLIGGPPCQDFSSAGPNNLRSKRASMLERFGDFVGAMQPGIFVMENVPRTRLTSLFTELQERVHSADYVTTTVVLDASFYGVPQRRKRMFFIGCKIPDIIRQIKDKIIDQQSEKPLTLREYFGNELDVDHYFRVPTNYQRRGVFSIDAPSVTIRAVDRPIPSGYPGHPNDSAPIGPSVRAFSVGERARIQTFPPDFRWQGSKTNINTLIGNAVPVALAEQLAVIVKDSIKSHQLLACR